MCGGLNVPPSSPTRTSGSVRDFGGSSGVVPVVSAGARHPRACCWHGTGCRVPAEAGGARQNPAKYRTGPLRTDLSLALDQVLERAELAQADRAAGVQLLRRVTDLGAHAELAAV